MRSQSDTRRYAYLDHGMTTLEELDEAGDDTTFDDAFDRGVLFFRQKLAEFCGGIKLAFWVIGEHSIDHLSSKLRRKRQCVSTDLMRAT